MPSCLPNLVAIILAMTSVGCGGSSYHLSGEVMFGEIFRNVSNFSIRNGHLTVENAGQSAEFPVAMQVDLITETDILKVENGEPVRLKITHMADEMRMNMELPDGPAEETIERGALQGLSVLFERDGKEWKSQLVGGGPTAEQTKEIQGYGSPWSGEIVPDHDVEVGDSWTIDGEQFREWFGIGREDVSSGRVQVYFEQIVDYDGQRCALLSVQLDATLRVPTTEVDGGTMSLSGEGFVYRSLAKKIDIYTKIGGTAQMEGEVFEQGQTLRTTISGPFVFEERVSKY